MPAEYRIVVGIDASAAADAALRWAIEHAGTHNALVRLVCAFRWTLAYDRPMYAKMTKVDPGYFRHVGEQVVAKALDLAGDFGPGVQVSGAALDGDAVPLLIEESGRASLVVLGSRQRAALESGLVGSVSASVAARAGCPTVVVPGPAGAAEQDPHVVVGVDPTGAPDELLAFGFEHACRHHLPLRAVLCWRPDLLASVTRRSGLSPNRAQGRLSEALAGWEEKYPDVAVGSAVIRNHPVAGLLAESATAQLLVVGSRGQPALPGTLLGSISQGVLHAATCPVAVVPTHGH